MEFSKNPTVSIIIPTYNRALLLGETIDSIRNQKFRDWECIIVDDRSVDYTKELMDFYSESDPRIKFLIRPESLPSGANACRNLGFKESIGHYVKWLDSDDLLSPDYLETKVKVFQDASIQLVVCNYILFNSNNSKSQPFNNISNSKDLLIDYITGKININAQSCLWKREALTGFYFNTNLERAQELDFHFRIFKKKILKVRFVEEPLVFIRDHEDSITGNFANGDLEAIRSDLQIRLEILEYLYVIQASISEKKKAFNLYLTGIRQLINFKFSKEIYYQFNTLEKKLKMGKKMFFWKIKLAFLLKLFQLTGRSYKLLKHINSFKI